MDYDSVLEQAVNAPSSASTVAGGDYDSMLEQAINAPAGEMQKSPEPTPGWGNYLKGFADRWELGMGGVSKGAIGLGLAGSAFEMEAAKQKLETKRLIEAQTDTEEYRNTHGYWDLAGVKIGGSDIMGGWLVEQLPQLAVTGVGAVGGIALASSVGIPLAAGALVGGAIVGGAIMGGNMVYDLMERGVDRETAIKGGIVSGVGGAALELTGLKGMGKAAAGASEAVLKSPSTREALLRVAKEIAGSMGTEIVTEDAQSLVDSTVKMLSTRGKEKPFTMKEAQEELLQSTLQSFVVAGQMSGASVGTGLTIGHVAKRVHAQLLANAAPPAPAKAPVALTASITKIEANRVRAKKHSRKFLNVSQAQSASVADAMANLEDAQKVYDAVPADLKDKRTIAKLELDRAEQALKEAKLQARIESISEALTDPDLKQTIADRQADLTQRLDALDATIQQVVAAQGNKRVIENLMHQRNEFVAELAQLKDFAEMGAEEMQAKLAEMKVEIQEKADKLKAGMARVTLNQRIAKLESKLKQLEDDHHNGLMALTPSSYNSYTSTTVDGVTTVTPSESRLERAIRETKEEISLEKFVLELLDQGLLDRDEIEKAASRSPRTPIGKLNAILKMVERKIDAAAQLGMRTQRTAKRALKRIIDRIIDTSRLSKDDRNALRAKLNDADSVTDLQEAYLEVQQKVSDIFEKRRKQALLADLDDLVGSLKFSKRERAQFPGVEEQLLAIKALVKNPGEADNVRNTLAAQIANNQPLDFHQQGLQTALDFWFPGDGDVKKMNSDQIEEIVNAVSDLKTKGSTNKLARVLEAQQKIADQRAEMMFHLLTNPKTGKQKSIFDSKDEWYKFRSQYLKAPWLSWEGLMNWITRNGTVSALTQVFDLKKANHDYWAMRDKWSQRWSDLLDAAGVDKKTYQKNRIAWEGQSDIVTFQIYDGQSGVREKAIISVDGEAMVVDSNQVPSNAQSPSVWELMQIRNYLKDTDPDAVSRLTEGNGFSRDGLAPTGQTALERVEAALNDISPDTLKVAEAARTFYQEFAEVVDQASLQRFGRHIPVNHTYGGPLLSDPTQRYGEMFRRMTTRPASLLERQGGSKPVKIRNMLDVMNDQIHQYSREHAYYEFEMSAKALFADKEIRAIIERTSGKNVMKVIDKYIDDLILGHFKVYSAASDVFGFVRRLAFTRYLGLKPSQFIKQLTAWVYAFQTGVTPAEVFEAYATFLSDPKRWIKAMNDSPVLKNRALQIDPDYKGGGIPLHVLSTLLKSKIAKGKKAKIAFEAYENIALKSLQKGDIYGVYLAAFPAYLKELKASGDVEKAQLAFERAFETTQSSGAIEELPALFRGTGLERMGTIFTQQPTRQVEAIGVAWDKYLNTGKGEDLQNVFVTAATSWTGALLYNLVGAMIMYRFLPDDDAEKKLATALFASALGPYAGIAWFGTLTTSMFLTIASAASDTSLNIHEPGFLLTDVGSEALRLTGKGAKLIVDRELDAEHMWELILASWHLAAPVPEPVDLAVKASKK